MGRTITEVRLDELHPHEKNPRIDAAQVEDLVESIREHGVEVPLVAAPRLGADGYVLLAGHRRLTAAHELALATVPVEVREDLADARDQLAFIATENLHREDLTAMEESRLLQDMLDLGWTQAQIAKATALPKPRVSERIKLGRLAVETGEKVHRGQVSIEDALVLAEYSDDPDAVEELERSLGTYGFDWAASRAKQRREARLADEAVVKAVRKAGGRIAAEGADVETVTDLVAAGRFHTPTLNQSAHLDNEEWAELEASEHASCPGHCYAIQYGAALAVCDRADELHPAVAGAADGEVEPEAEPDPWDELTPEDFQAAAIHRMTALAAALPRADFDAEARAELVRKITTTNSWNGYGNVDDGIAFLEGITGKEGRAKVAKVLASWPIATLLYLDQNFWDLKSHHRYMAEGKQGSSYWGRTGAFRKLLDAIGYEPSPVEQRAHELATGEHWDGTPVDPAEPAAAVDGAEAGEAA